MASPDGAVLARMAVLVEVSAAALRHPSHGGIYGAVARSIARHFDYLEVSVFEVREREGAAVLAAQWPAHELGQSPPYRQPLGEGLVGLAAREGRSVVVNDVGRDPRYVAPPRGRGQCKAELCTPVFLGEEVAAVIAVESREANAFGDGDRLALEAIANMVGLALQAAREHEELERQCQQVRQAQCQLVHSERLADVGRLASRVAHEIRNPLSTIGGFARRILRLDGLGEPAARYAAVIVEETERLERLLGGIMDFVRPGQPEKRATDLNAILRRALDMSEAARVGKDIRVVESLAPDLPPVLADPGQMEQVFINLIRNAFDAIAEAGTVEVASRRVGDDVLVSIEDTGVGIAPEQLARIFDPFFSTKPGGTGLGLSVASKIIDDHGGRILIGSEAGKGTHARVRLRIAKPSSA